MKTEFKQLTEQQAIDVLKNAMDEVDAQLHKFKYDNRIIIESCLQQYRYDDLLKMFYKAGFLVGMKFAKNQRAH